MASFDVYARNAGAFTHADDGSDDFTTSRATIVRLLRHVHCEAQRRHARTNRMCGSRDDTKREADNESELQRDGRGKSEFQTTRKRNIGWNGSRYFGFVNEPHLLGRERNIRIE